MNSSTSGVRLVRNMLQQFSSRLMYGVLLVGSTLPVGLRRWLQSAPLTRSLRARFLERLSRTSARRAHRVLSGPAAGLKMALSLPDEKGFWLGTFETAAAETLAAHCRPGDVCWDIGTYIGYFSLIMARNAQQTVYCFEPLAGNRQRIAEQQELNPELKLTVFPWALGAAPGQADFVVMNDASMGKLAASSFQTERAAQARLTVEVKTIDDVVAQDLAPPPDLIKIDTEGAEYQVLRGAERTLAEHHPRILLEVHGCAEDEQLLELLTAAGYRWMVAENNSAEHDAGEAPPKPGQHILCQWAGAPGTASAS